MKHLNKCLGWKGLVLVFAFMVSGSFLGSTAFGQYQKVKNIKIQEEILNEKRVFDRDFIELKEKKNAVANKRTLSKRRSNRAYEGAPPRIPHPVVDFMPNSIGKDCQTCHVMSGYVKRFGAYAPMTPHPDWGSCRQCHVPMRTGKLFKRNKFEGFFNNVIAETGNTAILPGGPPPIPHSIEHRGKCLSCHAGLASIKRIKTSHPERENCRQCHVPSSGKKWKRGKL